MTPTLALVASLLTSAATAASPQLFPERLDGLDQAQLLTLHEQVEGTLPRRWPGGVSLGVGLFGLLPTGIVGIVGAATRDRNVLITTAIMFAVASALTIFGIVFLTQKATERERIYTRLRAIEARLDELERAQPPAPELLPEPSPPPPPPHVGALALTVLDARTGQALADVAVALGGRSYRTDSTGRVAVEGLDPGPVTVELTRDGYQLGSEAVAIVAGQRATVSTRLVPAGARTLAKLSGVVQSGVDGAPLAATLSLAGRTLTADARGVFSAELEAGRYAVRIAAAGYVDQLKEVTLKEGERAIFNVVLHKSMNAP